MANNKSASKRNRQTQKRNLRNRNVLGSMRTALKKARQAVDSKQGNAAELISAAISRIDSAVGKGVLKRNTASRLVSRLSRRSA